MIANPKAIPKIPPILAPCEIFGVGMAVGTFGAELDGKGLDVAGIGIDEVSDDLAVVSTS